MNEKQSLDIRCKDMLMRIATMANASGTVQDRFIGLWKSRSDYDKHLAKRGREQVIATAIEYAEQIFNVIARSKNMVMAVASNDFATGKLQIETDGWMVLIGSAGHVVTSYRYLPDNLEFLDRQRDAGDMIHEYGIDEELGKLLESVFNRP